MMPARRPTAPVAFDFSALPQPDTAPVLTRFTITDFEAGDQLRFGHARFIRDHDPRAMRDGADGPQGPPQPGFRRLLDGEDADDHALPKLTFVNRSEADRIETLVRLDLDDNGAWDFEIALFLADLPSRCDDDLAA